LVHDGGDEHGRLRIRLLVRSPLPSPPSATRLAVRLVLIFHAGIRATGHRLDGRERPAPRARDLQPQQEHDEHEDAVHDRPAAHQFVPPGGSLPPFRKLGRSPPAGRVVVVAPDAVVKVVPAAVVVVAPAAVVVVAPAAVVVVAPAAVVVVAPAAVVVVAPAAVVVVAPEAVVVVAPATVVVTAPGAPAAVVVVAPAGAAVVRT